MSAEVWAGAVRPVGWGAMASATYELVVAESQGEARRLLLEKLGAENVLPDAITEKLELRTGAYGAVREHFKTQLWLDYGTVDYTTRGVPMGMKDGLAGLIAAYEELQARTGISGVTTAPDDPGHVQQLIDHIAHLDDEQEAMIRRALNKWEKTSQESSCVEPKGATP
jgi:hypothetical protein